MESRQLAHSKARGMAVFWWLLAGIILLALPGSSQAALASTTAAIDAAGELAVTMGAKDGLSIICQAGFVKINGAAPGGIETACSQVKAVSVQGGSGDNRIDLQALSAQGFPNLVTITVQAGPGADHILAGPLPEMLIGGTGEDYFVGTQPDDKVFPGEERNFFLEATAPSLDGSHGQFGGVISAGPVQESVEGVAAPDAPGLDTSFNAYNFDDNATLAGSLFIPPDPIGASGPNHVVNVVNVGIEFFNKAGVRQYQARLGRSVGGSIVGSFFEPLTPANTLFDPKVIYDQYAGRFLVVALEQVGTPTNTSRILLAVSDDSDPNGTWYYQAINSAVTIDGQSHWADYPGFAVDSQAVYITNNMFSFAGLGTYGGTRLWIIPKGLVGGLYSGGTSTVGIYDPFAGGGIATTAQPAHMFGREPGSTGTFLLSYSGLSDGTNEFIQIVRVDNPLTIPVFTPSQINVGNIDATATLTLPDAPQSGTSTLIEVNDRRTLNAVWRDSSLWVSTTVIPPSGADANQTTAFWLRFATSSIGAASLADLGAVGAEDLGTGTYTFFPSLAVDPCGDMAIGFAASNSSIYPGAYYTGRLASDPGGSVQTTGTLAAGTDYYVRTFSGTRNRWGDYSGISLDPANEASFWVYNEYAMTRGTPTGSQDGRWATRYGAFRLYTAGYDLGDLPASYNLTLRGTDGPRHCQNGLYLGASVDVENDGQPDSMALGDDHNNTDDEDGIVRGSGSGAGGRWQDGANGGAVVATVGGAGSGYLNAWLDWNADGDFVDANEQIITNVAVSAGNVYPRSFTVPAGTFTGSGPNKVFNARFRLSPSQPLNAASFYAGTASGGEVEDYQWSFTPTSVTLASFAARQPEASRLLAGAAVLFLAVLAAAVWRWVRMTNS